MVSFCLLLWCLTVAETLSKPVDPEMLKELEDEELEFESGDED